MTGRRFSMQKKSTDSTLRNSGSPKNRCSTSSGSKARFSAKPTFRTIPNSPTTSTICVSRAFVLLARIAWRGNDEGWDAFYRELVDEHYDRMAAMGIRFRLFPPKITYRDGVFTAATDDGSQIYYIKEGSDDEHRYKRPLHTDQPHLYRFFTRYRTARSPYVADKSYHRTIVPAFTLTTSMGESSSTPYSNAEKYKGLSRTRRACRQQDWIRYDFANAVRCREMYLQTGNRQLPKTIVTTGYAEVSYDGERFERAGELEKGSITLHPDRPIKSVRIVSTCNDNGTPYVTIQPPRIKPIL